LQDEAQSPDSDFKPNLVNTVCFLVNYQVQLTTFAVNYIGHPFNTSVFENKYMANMLKYGTLLFVVLALDILPGFSSGFSLVSITCASTPPCRLFPALACFWLLVLCIRYWR
jgi:cation-transporting ATPase 13A1